jgi:hypothetical protein
VNVTIHKNFNQTTPFSEASNDDEMAQIMVLRYPKACSGFERGAMWFATTIEEIRQYEAWKYIGFDTFEAFCRAKLGQTIHEVEEIVEGVRILGGNPTVEEAKKASRSTRAAGMVIAGTHSVTEAARECGISHPAVSKAVTKKTVTKEKVTTPPQPTIKLAKDPALTAKNIKAKMGEEWARALVVELLKGGAA